MYTESLYHTNLYRWIMIVMMVSRIPTTAFRSSKIGCRMLVKQAAAAGTLHRKENNSLIICGPSGVGKGTVIKSLLSQWGEDRISLSVSHTTRQPRIGEVNGVHYNFVTKEYMNDLLKQHGSFLEHAQVHDNLYGTSRQAVDYIHQQGKTCILDVDINGVKSMKALKFPGKYVFLAPPSIDSLMERLRGRDTETEAQIKLRMQSAADTIAYGTQPNNFDLVLVNNDLDKAVQLLNLQLSHWFPHTFQQPPLPN